MNKNEKGRRKKFNAILMSRELELQNTLNRLNIDPSMIIFSSLFTFCKLGLN